MKHRQGITAELQSRVVQAKRFRFTERMLADEFRQYCEMEGLDPQPIYKERVYLADSPMGGTWTWVVQVRLPVKPELVRAVKAAYQAYNRAADRPINVLV